MMLSEDQIRRYSRHIIMPEIGEKGQKKISEAKVLIVGAGGLGCPVLQYLTAAGVGSIGIIDDDIVEESNLQRQILFTVDDIGQPKVAVAKSRLQKMNPCISFSVYPEKLTTQNALAVIEAYDIIVDGTDNFSTRYLINDACVILDKPFVYGALYKFEGQVAVFNYQNSATYRCVFPTPPSPDSIPNCSEAGVLGVLPGIIGCMQANEVLKLILGLGQLLTNQLLLIDALSNQQTLLQIKPEVEKIQHIKNHKENFQHTDYAVFCGVKQSNEIESLTAQEIKMQFDSEYYVTLDVRESFEEPEVDFPNVMNIPLGDLPSRFLELNKKKKIVVCCQHGIRSLRAIQFLSEQGFESLINLKGGVVG